MCFRLERYFWCSDNIEAVVNNTEYRHSGSTKRIPRRESSIFNNDPLAQWARNVADVRYRRVNSKSAGRLSIPDARSLRVTFSRRLESIDVPVAPIDRGRSSLGVKPRANYEAGRFLARGERQRCRADGFRVSFPSPGAASAIKRANWRARGCARVCIRPVGRWLPVIRD